MQRSERCQGDSGLELWRRLYMEWRGAAPQITMIQAEQFQSPQRAPSLAVLWDYLERWQTLGAEVESSGYEVPEWVKTSAILKLLPKDLEAQVVARPELRTYDQRLSWVKAQLAHQRATTQAQAVAAGRSDMALGELGGDAGANEPVLARLEALEQLVKKGKGKGRGPGGGPQQPHGGKGGPKGGGGGGAVGGQPGPTCWHCGKSGHRRS
eukprot:2232217-Lingulodinium_polyedra.AAC.1